MARMWKKHRTKPSVKVTPKALEPVKAPQPAGRLPKNPAYARTVILIGSAIPPICGRIPEGPGYHRWC